MSQSLTQPRNSEVDLERLLAQMTLEEKAGQLNQPPNLDQISDEDVREGRIGSIICAYNAFAGNEKHTRVRVDMINRLQKIAVEESRLGIPLVFARDVIHGYRTIAPIPLGQGASFSPSHVRSAYQVAATEAAADGIRWAFAPM
ncbi:MAG: glycoside hydrolase family 3 N-terminal domain-containing protein, partial [bacterium]